MENNEFKVPRNEAKVAAPTPMLDLSTVHNIDSAEYEVLHPITGAPTGGFILLAGPEHPLRKELVLGMLRRARTEAALRETQLIEASRKPGRFKVPEGSAARDPAEDIKEGIDTLVKATLGWRGIGKNGQLTPFSPEAAAELYGSPDNQWLVGQLLEQLNNAELFIKA